MRVFLLRLTSNKLIYSLWKILLNSNTYIPDKNPTSWTSNIPNIQHPEHRSKRPTSQTSHISNISHPQHSTSRTSHISNIPYLEHPTSLISHILNILNPQHSTYPTSPYLQHPTCSICHFSSIPHSQHPTSRQTNHIVCINWNRIQYLSRYLQVWQFMQIMKFQMKITHDKTLFSK